MSRWIIRRARDEDRRSIVPIWHAGWHDAHRDLVPPDILFHRRPQHFELWLNECMDDTFVAEASETVTGFHSLSGTEVSKLYVARSARGSGVAAALLAHAEQILADGGAAVAELFCTAGNLRAQRFYERHGWGRTETFPDRLWLPDDVSGERSVTTHRYEKRLDG